jgi:PTS system galactitol-specific IIA component
VSGKLELSASLVHFYDQPVTRDEAILGLVSMLEEQGYVKPSFGQACIDREKVFPTGLPTEPFGIAIPHTDCEHVERGALAVGVLPESVQFVEMGCLDDAFVDVHVIVVLAIADPQVVAGVLQQLALAFQDAAFITGLKQAGAAEAVLELFAEQTPAVVQVLPSRVASEDPS